MALSTDGNSAAMGRRVGSMLGAANTFSGSRKPCSDARLWSQSEACCSTVPALVRPPNPCRRRWPYLRAIKRMRERSWFCPLILRQARLSGLRSYGTVLCPTLKIRGSGGRRVYDRRSLLGELASDRDKPKDGAGWPVWSLCHGRDSYWTARHQPTAAANTDSRRSRRSPRD
jgi:hypothetical protein